MSNLKLIVLLILVGCSPIGQTQRLYSISSKAKCKGPSREYHTELHATVDGYTRFHQSYFDGDSDYDAIIYNDSLGFTLTGDTLDHWTQPAEISVGLGHSFHMIVFDPKLVFNQLDNKFYDALGTEVKFKFDDKYQRVKSFQITNPFNGAEKIDIYYSKWQNVQGIDLPMNVQIIQGGKGEFFFEFYEVKIDDPDFTKIPIPKLPH